jgi:hypothetical protein
VRGSKPPKAWIPEEWPSPNQIPHQWLSELWTHWTAGYSPARLSIVQDLGELHCDLIERRRCEIRIERVSRRDIRLSCNVEILLYQHSLPRTSEGQQIFVSIETLDQLYWPYPLVLFFLLSPRSMTQLRAWDCNVFCIRLNSTTPPAQKIRAEVLSTLKLRLIRHKRQARVHNKHLIRGAETSNIWGRRELQNVILARK